MSNKIIYCKLSSLQSSKQMVRCRRYYISTIVFFSKPHCCYIYVFTILILCSLDDFISFVLCGATFAANEINIILYVCVYAYLYTYTAISFTGRLLHCSRGGKNTFYVIYRFYIILQNHAPFEYLTINTLYVRTNYNNVCARGLSLGDKCRNPNANCAKHCCFFSPIFISNTHTAPLTRKYTL